MAGCLLIDLGDRLLRHVWLHLCELVKTLGGAFLGMSGQDTLQSLDLIRDVDHKLDLWVNIFKSLRAHRTAERLERWRSHVVVASCDESTALTHDANRAIPSVGALSLRSAQIAQQALSPSHSCLLELLAESQIRGCSLLLLLLLNRSGHGLGML